MKIESFARKGVGKGITALPKENTMDITSFLYGMYYAGKLPSRVEIKEISQYLRSEGFVKGKQQEIEEKVRDAMAAMHQAIYPEDEQKIEEKS